jgi:hypothetical protein
VMGDRTLYINTNYNDITFSTDGTKMGLLSRKTFEGSITLPAKGADLIQPAH